MINSSASAHSNQQSANQRLMEILTSIDQRTGHACRPSGNGYSTRCPAHNDQKASLSGSVGDNETILLHCHAGCTPEAVCEAAGIGMRDLFPDSSHEEAYRDHAWLQPRTTQQQTKVTEYHYKDAQGNTVYTKVKTESNDGKNYFWKHIDGSGATVMGKPRGSDKILYNLPAVLEAIKNGQPIFAVEGEKDAETLIGHGCVATTATETVSWPDSFTDLLKGADIVLLYDTDKAGLKRKELITKSMAGKVKSLRIIDLPGLAYTESHGKDVTDWLDEGHTIAELQAIIAKTEPYHAPTGKLRVVSLDQLFSKELPPRTMLLDPILPRQGLAMLAAKRGVGKTHVALGIAYAVASGGKFLRWSAPEPKRVLYVDGEMPAVVMQERLKMIEAGSDIKADPNNLMLLTPDWQEDDVHMPDLSKKEGRDALEEHMKDVDLIILDNISCLFRTGSENEADSWQEVQSWELNLRRRGKSVLSIHHTGKNGLGPRGTSKREDTLDTVILLQHSSAYKPADGAHFEVSFTKARHIHGADANPFMAQLKIENDACTWETSDTPEEAEVDEVAQLKKDGLTIEEIMRETNLTKSQVERRTKKAIAKGLLPAK